MRGVVRMVLVVGMVWMMGSLALAAEGKKPKKPFPAFASPEIGRMDPFAILKRLNLSEEQKAKIEELRKEYEPKLSELREKMDGVLTPEQKKAREEIIRKAKEKGLKGPELFAAIRNAFQLTEEQQKQMKELQTQMVQLTQEIREKISEILTEEQKAQLRRSFQKGAPKQKAEEK